MTPKKSGNCSKIEQLSHILTNNGWRIACAESCTGGWLAKLFTDRAGSSAWFECGFVTYSNRAKHGMLGLSNALLDKYGAVSDEVVQKMAEAACERANAEVAIAISGIAGPTGGSDAKPVGLVWFAYCINGKLQSHSKVFKGGRDAVRQQAVSLAVDKLLDYLQAASKVS